MADILEEGMKIGHEAIELSNPTANERITSPARGGATEFKTIGSGADTTFSFQYPLNYENLDSLSECSLFI